MNLLFGISGSIAVLGIHAYLARLMTERHIRVSAVMTRTAASIVNPAALGAILRAQVVVDDWNSGQARPPCSLVEECDVMLVAPASATTIAFCAGGVAANIVSACYLAHRGRTLFAPAMAPTMLHHPAVERNLRQLAADGAEILPCSRGFQVSSGQWSDGGLCDFSQMGGALARQVLTRIPDDEEVLHGAA